MRTLEEYLHLPYRIALVHDYDDEGNAGWVAEVEERPGCMAQGGTVDEAVDRLQDAMISWLSVALEDEKEIPEPRELDSFSGRFLLRIPRSLHSELAHAAEREGTSLNQFVTAALAAAVRWRASRDSVIAQSCSSEDAPRMLPPSKWGASPERLSAGVELAVVAVVDERVA